MPVPSEPERVSARRVLLKDAVRERLRDAIMNETLAPGETLRDSELIEWLGVSRTPLRDALNDLAREGLVEMAPNRYTRVASVTGAQAIAAAHTLGSVYSAAIRFALPTLTPDKRLELQEMCTLAVGSIRRGDGATTELFTPIFDAIVANGANEVYRDRIAGRLDGIRFAARLHSISSRLDDDGRATLAGAMTALGEAIGAGDVDGARQATELAFFGWVGDEQGIRPNAEAY